MDISQSVSGSEGLNSSIISSEKKTDCDSKPKPVTDKSFKEMWQCMNRIDKTLDSLFKHFDIELPEVQEVVLHDKEFLLLFPLTEIEEVADLEARLLLNKSGFKNKLISIIGPTSKNRYGYELKSFVRTTLRGLFTYSLASNFSWRGFRGNYEIGNLEVVKIIFDMSKKKFRNASREYVYMLIKEWIRYAKQRQSRLNKIKSI